MPTLVLQALYPALVRIFDPYQSTIMSVIEHIKKVAVRHGEAYYSMEEWCWKFNPVEETRKGVYIFVSKDGDILKVGKADGKRGLLGRLNEYWKPSKSFLKNPSSSASVMKRVQEADRRVVDAVIYYIPLDPIQVTVSSFSIQATPARELEEFIAARAHEEGHSLLFSKQK